MRCLALVSLLLLLLALTLGATAAPLREMPSRHTSAKLARRLLRLAKTGTLSTVFAAESGRGGRAIGLPDYVAACDPVDASNPTLLALPIATSFRNGLARGANVSLALKWGEPWSAEMPRLALMGYLEEVGAALPAEVVGRVQACFLESHPDARRWVPGNRVHRSFWVRLVVREVFWIGGFGDRAFIGWIPVKEWRGITRKEIEEVRLPGEEEGWEEERMMEVEEL
ncbi:MAG: hypothetical protein M1840_002230 [Geoglossum simile]|nr:MAG: hypothetical protein M1840_002230 [Geoglossum simile]